MRYSVLVLLACSAASATADADIIIAFDPDDLTVLSSGLNQSFAVDLQITHDGPGENTISGFTVDITDPGVGLTITNPTTSPFVWNFAGPETTFGGGVYSIGASSFTNNTIPADSTVTLATVMFNLDDSISDHVFPLDLSLRDATRDFFSDISNEVTVTDSSFTVQDGSSAVPEPSMRLALVIGILLIGMRIRLREAS
jgi:hypothetical protein